jgi:hypothetical protein
MLPCEDATHCQIERHFQETFSNGYPPLRIPPSLLALADFCRHLFFSPFSPRPGTDILTPHTYALIAT